MFECYEATRDLELQDVEIETPICKTTVKELKRKETGSGTDSACRTWHGRRYAGNDSCCKVGHIGLYRDPETAKPIEYYCKLPADCCQPRSICRRSDVGYRRISHHPAIQMLKDKGVKSIRFYVHHCCTGRCKSTYRCSPGC